MFHGKQRPSNRPFSLTPEHTVSPVSITRERQPMKVLVACEFSGIVRDAFISRGCKAVSCDLLPTERPGPHFQGSVQDIITEGWDLMICHPPCTHLAVSGARHFAAKQASGVQQEAIDFVRFLLNAPIPRIALENPISIISSRIRKPDQIIQPWQFGHEAQKTTCLWLKNLPLLLPTNIVGKGERTVFASGKSHPKWYADALKNAKTKEERQTLRSKTFEGMAQAFAEQWGGIF